MLFTMPAINQKYEAEDFRTFTQKLIFTTNQHDIYYGDITTYTSNIIILLYGGKCPFLFLLVQFSET